MTITTRQVARMPLLERKRAERLPPPAQRRAIRETAKVSREDIAAELRAQGFQVTAAAVVWWEKEKAEGGCDPRSARAIAYRELLERILAELHAQDNTDQAQK